MFEVFFDIQRQYPHIDDNYMEGASEMFHYLIKAQALIAQDGVAGLELGVRTARMMLFLANRTEFTDLGLAGLQYLRQYYGHPDVAEDPKLYLPRSMVYYIPYLAGMVQISRKEFEEYVADTRNIATNNGISEKFLECYYLQALRAMGEVETAEKRAKPLRVAQWNEEIDENGCRSCSQVMRAEVALAYQDIPQAVQIAEEWLEGSCKSCTRGPQGFFSQLALACFRQGDRHIATSLVHKMEQVLQDSQYKYVTRESLIHLLQYYIETEQWSMAEKWFRNLTPGTLSTIFSVQRLLFLRAGLQLIDHWSSTEQTSIVLPREAIPIPADANGNFKLEDLQQWFKAEEEALRQIINSRNDNSYY